MSKSDRPLNPRVSLDKSEGLVKDKLSLAMRKHRSAHQTLSDEDTLKSTAPLLGRKGDSLDEKGTKRGQPELSVFCSTCTQLEVNPGQAGRFATRAAGANGTLPITSKTCAP